MTAIPEDVIALMREADSLEANRHPYGACAKLRDAISALAAHEATRPPFDEIARGAGKACRRIKKI